MPGTTYPTGPADVAGVRELARAGRLAGSASAAPARDLARLRGAVYTVTWPLVFARITKPLELQRRHPDCLRGLEWMRPDCLDGFHDDVEAVVEHALRRATDPIENLEGWLATRLNPATVDAHRKRRGEIGALQRPRLPGWLGDALGRDPWLGELAVQILLWAGVPATAGGELWPLAGWAARRAEVTGEPATHDMRDTLDREVRTVLAAMRTRPKWYTAHVERPLGHKRAPVAPMPAENSAELSPLELVRPHEVEDARLTALAEQALRAIEARLGRGQDPATAVTAVVRVVFGAGALEALPHSGSPRDDWLATALADEARLGRIVATVLALLAR
ncbi:hypothetical protein ACIOD2_34345 [Amycolatopsis sp. NPDC088138]|uniref:hypothetical protein n=1 Tax=Amycolatopsis sp. NPDC088138 TaxID=3363938 RepID=UPI0037F3D4E7